MTMSEPNPAVGPTGGEAVEFVDVPESDRPTPPPPPPSREPDRPEAPDEDPLESLPPGAGHP